jgi:hypothetical protein
MDVKENDVMKMESKISGGYGYSHEYEDINILNKSLDSH